MTTTTQPHRWQTARGFGVDSVVGPANTPDYVPPQPHASTHGLTATTHDGFSSSKREVAGTPMTTTTWHDPLVGTFDVPGKRFGVDAMKLQGYFVAPYVSATT